MKGFYKRLKDFFKVYHTTKLFLLLLLLSLVMLVVIDYKWINSGENLKDFIGNVLVEAHGVLGDLIIFGVILTIYDTYKKNQEKKEKKKLERKTKIERLKDEIDDYRGWDAEEAKFRIIGNIKRLNRLNHFTFSLDDCYLPNSEMNDLIFYNTDFYESDCKNSNFSNSDFEYCNIKNSNFSNCCFGLIGLSDISLRPKIINCNFSKSNLTNSVFTNIRLQNINVLDAKLDGLTFSSLHDFRKLNPKSREYIKSNYSILSYSDFFNRVDHSFIPANQIKLTLKYFNNYFNIQNKKNLRKNNFYFLIKKEDAEEYKKNNKRIIKE